MRELTWVEISKEALTHNISQFRNRIGNKCILCPCVKANAYGHGLIETAKVFREVGADWLAVNSIHEAETLRDAGIQMPIYVMGYVALDSLQEVAELDCRLVVYNRETVEKLASEAAKKNKVVKVHLKVETGNNRQGVFLENLVNFAKFIKSFESLELEGLATHFANIEDTTDHSYAESQLDRFKYAIELLRENGIEIPIKHCANSAATIIFPETHFDMVRAGIATYGLWPSNETYISYMKESSYEFELKPVFAWKTIIAQIKTVGSGEFIGYGCTYKTTRDTKIAILPVGYYDGYDRCTTGAHVLVRGRRAPVRGRVCMNIIMVDITDIPEAEVEDEVVLIGKNGEEKISMELFAQWAGTINYEIPTRINERIPRIVV